MVDPKTKLSEHLDVRGFTRSGVANRAGIDNGLPEKFQPHAGIYAKKCFEAIRHIWGDKPRNLNGGFRSEELNILMVKFGYRPSKTSQHMYANAGDYDIVDDEKLIDLFLQLLQAENFQFDQLMIEGAKANDPDAGWIHCSYNTYSVLGDHTSEATEDGVQRNDIKIVEFVDGEPKYVSYTREAAIEWCQKQLNSLNS